MLSAERTHSLASQVRLRFPIQDSRQRVLEIEPGEAVEVADRQATTVGIVDLPFTILGDVLATWAGRNWALGLVERLARLAIAIRGCPTRPSRSLDASPSRRAQSGEFDLPVTPRASGGTPPASPRPGWQSRAWDRGNVANFSRRLPERCRTCSECDLSMVRSRLLIAEIFTHVREFPQIVTRESLHRIPRLEFVANGRQKEALPSSLAEALPCRWPPTGERYMTRRLITLRRIRQEKIDRSRSWIFAKIAAGEFPKPLDLGGRGPNLWDEGAIDDWLENFIWAAQSRAANGGSGGVERVKNAMSARGRNREQSASV